MSEGDATAIENFVRSDLFRAILRTQHADLLSASTTAASTVPTGVVAPYAVASAPDGWLLCNGQDVYKDLYPALYALLTTTYGTPSDTLKFRVPDLQGRVPVGYGTGYTTLNAPAGATSVADHTHAMRHWHTVNNHTHTQTGTFTSGNENATQTFSNGTGATRTAPFPGHTHNTTISGETGGSTPGTGWAQNEGGAQENLASGGAGGHSLMQPYIVLNYIIRT